MKKFFGYFLITFIIFLALLNYLSMGLERCSPQESQKFAQEMWNLTEKVGDFHMLKGEISIKKGKIKIGGKAYIDGIDTSKSSTVMEINLWADNNMSSFACKLKHGTIVEIIGGVEISGLKWFSVRNGECKGVITEQFLCDKYRKPIGDRLIEIVNSSE